MMIVRYIFLIALLSLTSGCASWVASTESELAQTGPGTTIDSGLVKNYVEQQKLVHTQLIALTGLKAPSWDKIISAGLQYSDVRCSNYIESLYWVNKHIKADVKDVNAAGTLATGLMGIAKAAASEIAAVAVLFGYAESSISNSGSRILFELEPSAIRSLIEGSQKAFRGALLTGYNDQSGAFSVIREYVALCLPSTIEAEINNAAKNAVQTASSGNPETGEPPKVSINEGQVNISSHTYDSDVYSLLLKAYAFPGGTKNVAAHTELQKWLTSKKNKDPIGIFLLSDKYKDQWKQAVDFLRVSGNPKLE
jgi:hypothetical protein